jgi:hypothetical protein
MSVASRFRAVVSTESSRFRVSSSMSSPSVSRAPGAGSLPIGETAAWASPERRSVIHFRTRLFSPKPGHANLPEASLRNQLTK